MSDELDDLKAAMKAATPGPDPATRAAHIALAEKNFADLQGSRDGARPTSIRPVRGLFRGVAKMFTTLSTRGALAATTALAAFGLILIVPQLSQSPVGGLTGLTTVESAPVARPAPAPMPRARAQDSTVVGLMSGSQPTEALSAAPMDQAAGAIALGRVRQERPLADQFQPAESDTEAFPDAPQNPLKVTAEEPVSTFSIDVDTASYAVVRSSLTNGQLPPDGAVRIEEMINYFPYAYPTPDGAAPFRPTITIAPTPWNPGTQLVHVAIQGRPALTEGRPPLNLVLLIDTSGSMNQPDKLPLLRQSLALMLSRLSAEDSIAIVTYAGSAGQVLAPTPATDRAAIMAALDALSAGGSTAGQAGLQQAYAVAESMADEGEVTRVLLATDGDFNVGLSDPEALKAYIAQKRDSGTYLSVLGFGRGNLDDATMQALAQNGNGQAAYIDTLSEAQKVLVDQFSGALFPIADDVKIQLEFNPARVAEYRLIGYETRALRREDFNNDKVDAGEIGAGHSVTALYEITPVDSAARLTDPLRYGNAPQGDAGGEIGFLKLRYKAPGDTTSQLIELPLSEGGEVTAEMRFAFAIAGFGQLLTGATYLGDWGWDDAIALANAARGDDPFGYRSEAVRLMRLAQSLSAR